MRRAALVSLAFAFLAMTLSACSPAGELRGIGGEKILTFAGKNEKKYIRVENVSNIAGELGESYIIEGGVRKEESFKVVAGIKNDNYEPCKFPTSGEQLEKKGDACIIGVEITVAPGPTGTFVLEYGTIGGTRKEAKATMGLK